MLDALHLRGTPAFGSEVVTTIGPLTPVTFIFGPNGSGKTTISRAFADCGRFPGSEIVWNPSADEHEIKVYNRDYVSNTLKQAANLPGVFTLGEEDNKRRAEIDSLTSPEGVISTAKKHLSISRHVLADKQAEIKVERDKLKNAAWAKRNDVPSELHQMFVGFGNNKEKFLNRLVDAAASGSAVEDFDALQIEAKAILAKDATQVAEIPLGPHIALDEEAGFYLLATPIVGSTDVDLAPLIRQLRNADWVEHGRHYLDETKNLCPFCQQVIPTDLIGQLDAYFDMRYSQQIQELKNFQLQVGSWIKAWHAYFDDVLGRAGVDSYLNIERFQAVRVELELVLGQLTAALESKLSGPSASVSVIYPAVQVKALNDIVVEANISIKTFNRRLKNRWAARDALIERCWTSFAKGTLAVELAKFEAIMPGLVKGQKGLEEKIASQENILQASDKRLRELRAEITSSQPIIETINNLLKSVGFHSFRLRASSVLKDGYSLVRESGEIASDTLSEGEQTFITFLYFAQSLQGAPQGSNERNEIVAIIDDPISSLDSEVLYSVSTIVRRIAADIPIGKGRVRQIVLLTHNAHFHKEVTYVAQGEKTGGWQYGVITKQSGQPSLFSLQAHNPIQTAYASLWAEVKRSSQEPSASGASLQNILRRILETYFKVLGGVNHSSIIEKFEGADQTICRTLFSWINAGSHAIFDDLDYSPTATTVEMQLNVFRRIFEEHNQEGHYRMMMGMAMVPSKAEDEKNRLVAAV